jgi:dethiobiotin synthetase
VYELPVAPHLAAERQAEVIDFDRILRNAAELAGHADRILVEGVGGWRVPLGDAGDLADLAARMGLPVVLVVGVRLGCLSHALLTVESILARGCPMAGWVANCLQPDMRCLEENIVSLKQRIQAPCLGVVPWLSVDIANSATEYLTGY